MANPVGQRPPVVLDPPFIPEEEEELEPLFSEEQVMTMQTIAQLAIRILFPIGVTFMVATLGMPLAFQAVVLTVTAIGTSFLAAFFFNPDNFYVAPPSPKNPVQQNIAVGAVAAPGVQPPPLDPLVPRGIRNQTGLDCWLNSGLQLMNTDPGIREWIRNPLPPFVAPAPKPGQDPAAHQRFVEMKREEYRQFGAIHQAFRQFVHNHDAAVAQGAPVSRASSRALRHAIRQGNPLIGARGQEDADEGLTNVLEMLPREQKIQLRQTFHLDGYPDVSMDEDPDWRIPLAITGLQPNIPEMLRAHLDETIFDHAPNDQGVPNNSIERIVAGEVRRFKVMRKRWELIEAPPALRLQIKRFEFRKKPPTLLSKIPILNFLFNGEEEYESVKNEAAVSIPLQIQAPIGPIGNGQVQQNYELTSFNCHLGGSLKSGHYIAYVRRTINNENKWFCCNDASVTEVGLEEVTRVLGTGSPYLVWYSRA